jgi:hypothetical protein
MKSDYLKYWRVVRQFVKVKYGLSQADLDILLFLKSEEYFSKDKFDEFDSLISWNVHRFDNLLRDNWIEVFRKRQGKYKGVYTLSHKAKRVTTSIYKKLDGEEIPSSNDGNPMFLKNVSYTDKVYRNFIKEMNAATRQQRHQTPK